MKSAWAESMGAAPTAAGVTGEPTTPSMPMARGRAEGPPAADGVTDETTTPAAEGKLPAPKEGTRADSPQQPGHPSAGASSAIPPSGEKRRPLDSSTCAGADGGVDASTLGEALQMCFAVEEGLLED